MISLTFEQLLALHRLCEEYKDKLGSTEGGWESLDVSQISAVTFECCSLERLLMRKDLPLRRPDETTSQEEIAKDQLDTVDTVLQEFHIENIKEYWYVQHTTLSSLALSLYPSLSRTHTL